mgnify:FL=1
MINAKDAKQKTIIKCELVDLMDTIEQRVEETIEYGFYNTSIALGGSLNKNLVDALCKELTDLGYKVEYIPEKPLPYGCPSDQWDFNSYLKIDWSLEKGETGI